MSNEKTIDQPAVLVALLLIYSAITLRYWLAIALGGLAILVKDGLVIYSLLFIIFYFYTNRKEFLIGPIVMALIFVLLRISQDTDPLSLQYGWEISKGDIRLKYIASHLGGIHGIVNWLTGIWFSFGPFLILSIFFVVLSRSFTRKEYYLTISLISISLLFILAQLFLASRVARTLTPASIPIALVTLGLLYKYYSQKISSALGETFGNKISKTDTTT